MPEAFIYDAVRTPRGRGKPDGALSRLRERHLALASEIGLPAESREPVTRSFDDLGRRLEGVRLTGEVSPRLRARLLATGELASTRLGAAALARHGVAARWVDARELLRGRRRASETEVLPAMAELTSWLTCVPRSGNSGMSTNWMPMAGRGCIPGFSGSAASMAALVGSAKADATLR